MHHFSSSEEPHSSNPRYKPRLKKKKKTRNGDKPRAIKLLHCLCRCNTTRALDFLSLITPQRFRKLSPCNLQYQKVSEQQQQQQKKKKEKFLIPKTKVNDAVTPRPIKLDRSRGLRDITRLRSEERERISGALEPRNAGYFKCTRETTSTPPCGGFFSPPRHSRLLACLLSPSSHSAVCGARRDITIVKHICFPSFFF